MLTFTKSADVALYLGLVLCAMAAVLAWYTRSGR